MTAPPDPQPLPPIDADDVHLVCWMAIVPIVTERPLTIAEQLGEMPFGDKL
jgi:hypothetical protein